MARPLLKSAARLLFVFNASEDMLGQVMPCVNDLAAIGCTLPWLLIGTMIDLCPHANADELLAKFTDEIARAGLNPRGAVYMVSAKTGQGIPELLAALVGIGSVTLQRSLARRGAVRLPDAGEPVPLKEAATRSSRCTAS